MNYLLLHELVSTVIYMEDINILGPGVLFLLLTAAVKVSIGGFIYSPGGRWSVDTWRGLISRVVEGLLKHTQH